MKTILLNELDYNVGTVRKQTKFCKATTYFGRVDVRLVDLFSLMEMNFKYRTNKIDLGNSVLVSDFSFDNFDIFVCRTEQQYINVINKLVEVGYTGNYIVTVQFFEKYFTYYNNNIYFDDVRELSKILCVTSKQFKQLKQSVGEVRYHLTKEEVEANETGEKQQYCKVSPFSFVYKNIEFRSTTEAKHAFFFDYLGIDYEYEKESILLDDGLYSCPDFNITTPNRKKFLVEVKPKTYELTQAVSFLYKTRTTTPILISGNFFENGLQQLRYVNEEVVVENLSCKDLGINESEFNTICKKIGKISKEKFSDIIVQHSNKEAEVV